MTAEPRPKRALRPEYYISPDSGDIPNGRKFPGREEKVALKAAQVLRRQAISTLMRAGYNAARIVPALKQQGIEVTVQTVHKDIKAIFHDLAAETQRNAAVAKELDLSRIDDIFAALHIAVQRGHLQSIDRYLKAIALRKEILGYAAPARTEISGPDGQPLLPVVINNEFRYERYSWEELDKMERILIENETIEGEIVEINLEAPVPELLEMG